MCFHTLSTSTGNLVQEEMDKLAGVIFRGQTKRKLMTSASAITVPLEASQELWSENPGIQLVWSAFLFIIPEGQMKRGFSSELPETADPAACMSVRSLLPGRCVQEREREWPFLAPSPDSQEVLSEQDSANAWRYAFFFRTAP